MVKRSALEKLKLDWLEEPNWPIEDTEGFEEFRDELLAFRRKNEIRTNQHNQRLVCLAEELETTNLKLIRYLAKLEYRLAKLESSMTK